LSGAPENVFVLREALRELGPEVGAARASMQGFGNVAHAPSRRASATEASP
jgi:glutamate dehydrogenase/leucine dehydrogenase